MEAIKIKWKAREEELHKKRTINREEIDMRREEEQENRRQIEISMETEGIKQLRENMRNLRVEQAQDKTKTNRMLMQIPVPISVPILVRMLMPTIQMQTPMLLLNEGVRNLQLEEEGKEERNKSEISQLSVNMRNL